jgi:type IV pilus assembly protein PilW
MKPTTMRHIHTLADSPSGLGLQRGLTLIEMMIAITISLILLAGVMQIFTGSRQTYRVQDNMARLQENGRFAMDFLNKDIRMADHWGCMKGTNMLTNNLTGQVSQGTTAGLAGTDGGATGTDTITLATAMPSRITVMDQMPTSSAIIQASPNTLAVNSIAIISNCINGDIFQITNTANTGTGAAARTNLGHNTGAGVPGNTFNFKSPTCPGSAANCLSADYGSGAEILAMQTATYRILPDAANNNIPALHQSINGGADQPLVEGVENMQILYGEDTDMTFPALPLNAPPSTSGDGSANRYLPANLVGDMRRVVSVRIGLVLITAENNLAITPQVYTGLDGLPATAPDRRLRRVFSSTIQLRNRV